MKEDIQVTEEHSKEDSESKSEFSKITEIPKEKHEDFKSTKEIVETLELTRFRKSIRILPYESLCKNTLQIMLIAFSYGFIAACCAQEGQTPSECFLYGIRIGFAMVMYVFFIVPVGFVILVACFAEACRQAEELEASTLKRHKKLRESSSEAA